MKKEIKIVLLDEAAEENGAKVVAAITEFWGTKPEVRPPDFLQRDAIIQLGLAPVRIDIITSWAGIEFQSAWKNRVKAKYGDINVFFISLEDLIKNKRAVGRDRDLLDAKYLERIRKAKTIAKKGLVRVWGACSRGDLDEAE